MPFLYCLSLAKSQARESGQKRGLFRAPDLSPYSISTMWKSVLLTLCLTLPAVAQQKLSAPQLIDLAKSHSPTLETAIIATFDAKDLKEGTAWAGHGPDFFFATKSDSQPSLVIDDAAGTPMQRIAGSDLWYGIARIDPVGTLHAFHYLVSGAPFGGRL